MMLTEKVIIINKLGLHARASMKLVNLASRYESEIHITFKNHEVNAKSIMNVMILGAKKGSELTIKSNGTDEKEALKAIVKLIQDRFGENGITSVIVSNFLPKEIEIHIWVMSCRVFKREMEFAMFDKLVEIAKKKKKQTIKGIYIPSSKNKMVAEFYESLGFKRIESLKNEQNEIHYEIEVNNIKPLNKLIQIVNE